MVEEALVVGVAINHGVAINGPRLAATPHRPVSMALMGDAFDETACQRVINSHMVATAIFTEVVLHGRFSVFYSNILQSL